MPAGRPSSFTQAIADTICERIVEGESLRAICRDPDMPAISSVFKWLANDPKFADQYARSKEEQGENFADQIVAIADEEHTMVKDMGDGVTAVVYDSTAVARNRLRVDARKWVAAKLKPKKYGDRVEVDAKHSGNVGFSLTINRGKRES